MYVAARGRLAFGSVIAAPWLFDIYLREDSAALAKRTLRGGQIAYVARPEAPEGDTDFSVFAQATMDADDVVLAQGGRRMAIVLTDDCELASLAGERSEGGSPRGRILLAGVRKSNSEEIAEIRARSANL